MNRFKQRMHNSAIWRFLHRIRLRIKRRKSNSENTDYYESISIRSAGDYTIAPPYIELTQAINANQKRKRYNYHCHNNNNNNNNNDYVDKRISNTESIFTQRSLSDSVLFPDTFNLPPIRALDGQPIDFSLGCCHNNRHKNEIYTNLYQI